MEDEKEISRKEEDVSAIESTKNEHNSVEDNKEEDSRVDRDDRHEGGDTALSRSHLDSSSDSDSASDSDSDSDLDDEPPRLKYSRISNLPGTFFTRDPISTCTFQESIFIFATHSGTIHIAHSDLRSIRTLKAHKASILSLYTDGTYFASASMDGTVVIGSIFDEKDIIAYDFKRPVHAVILDKNYKHARSFITGGMSGKIIRSSKNWLGQRVDIVVDEGSGSPIVGIFQLQDLILWMNDEGISVYHTVTKTKISTISRPPNSPRGDMYWPRCYFPEVDRIVIAWADHIWLLRVSEGSGNGSGSGSGGAGGSGSNSSKIMIPSSATISFRATSQKVIEIEHILKLDDCLIAGISTYRDDLCIILAYNPPTNSEGKLKFHNPELKLINTTTGEITFEEEIGLRDVSNLGLNDYMLGTHIGENSLPRYFIVSAKDAVIAQEVTLEDQLNWFIGNERFLEAWKISEHLISPIKRLNLGVSYADSLIKQDKWHEIAQFLSTLLYLDENGLPDGDARSTIQQQQDTSDEYTKEVVLQWDNWSNIFIQTDHIELLTGIIPTSTKLGLSSELYTKILKYWLEENLTTFYQLLDSWDPELYDIKSIENLMEETLEADYGNDQLRRYISQLYVKSLEPMKSVNHLVILKDNNIMDFLEQHHLLGNFIDRIPDYIKLRFQKNELAKSPIDQLKIKVEDIVNLLVANRHELPSRTIVDLMIKNNLDFINNLYLEKLNDIDEYLTRGFSNERMVLYSQYDRGKLLGFLMKGNSNESKNDDGSGYDIDKAIELCETNQFTEELVYLLGKIGETRKALMLIINELDDPAKAIKFAKHQNDEEAWTILLDYSMNKPAFIKALIELADDQSSSFYDPILIIKRIPKNVQIDGLKASVTKISFNNELDLILNQLILKSIYKESEEVSRNFRYGKLVGVAVDAETDDEETQNILQKFESLVLYEDEKRSVKLATIKDFFKDRLEVQIPSVLKYTTFSEKINHLEEITKIA